MFRIARKSGLLLAALTASVSMSTIARADNPQQYQTYQQYAQPTNRQQYQPVQNQLNNQQFQPPAQEQQNQQFQQPTNLTAQNPVAQNRLSDEQVGAMLQQLGYNPQPFRNGIGGTNYTIKIERADGWKFVFTVSFSPDRTNLWFESVLANVPEGNNLSAQALLKMMEWNASSTAVFGYRSNGRVLVIEEAVPDHRISTENVRAEAESFMTTIEKTHSLWSEQSLSVPNNPPATTTTTTASR